MTRLFSLIASFALLSGCSTAHRVSFTSPDEYLRGRAIDSGNSNAHRASFTIPPAVSRALADATELTLYSIEPTHNSYYRLEGKQPPPGPDIRGYAILGQVRITSPEMLDAVRRAIAAAVADGHNRVGNCFDPRHAIRIASAHRTYDLVLCYECRHLYIFTGDREIADVPVGDSPAVLNNILQAAHIPLATQPTKQ